MISSDITPTEYWTDLNKKEIKKVFKTMIEETYSNVCKTCGD
jgi:hypothetical protein